MSMIDQLEETTSTSLRPLLRVCTRPLACLIRHAAAPARVHNPNRVLDPPWFKAGRHELGNRACALINSCVYEILPSLLKIWSVSQANCSVHPQLSTWQPAAPDSFLAADKPSSNHQCLDNTTSEPSRKHLIEVSTSRLIHNKNMSALRRASGSKYHRCPRLHGHRGIVW
jgi:hypothetical protein